MKEQTSFWITNISKYNVSIYDLNLTIKAFSSVNLLDNKHYSYTLEQLEKSLLSGSLFKKRDKLTKRKSAPILRLEKKEIIEDAVLPDRKRSIFENKDSKYEELNVFDEFEEEDPIQNKKV